MIEIKVTKGDSMCKIDGNLVDLCTDCITAVHMVYGSIKESNECAAERFKEIFLDMVNVAFIAEDDLEIELLKKRKAKKVSKRQDTIATLKDVLGILENGGSIDDALEPLYKALKEEK